MRNVRPWRGRRVSAITGSPARGWRSVPGTATDGCAGRLVSAIENLVPGYTTLGNSQNEHDAEQDKRRGRLIGTRRAALAYQPEDVDGGCVHRPARRRVAQHVDMIDGL